MAQRQALLVMTPVPSVGAAEQAMAGLWKMYLQNWALFWLRNWKRGGSCEDRGIFVCKIYIQDDGFGFSESVKWDFLRQAIMSWFDSGENPSINMQTLEPFFSALVFTSVSYADISASGVCALGTLGFISDCLFFSFLHVWMFAYMYVCVSHACLVPMKMRREDWSPWNQSYRWLSAAMCVLGFKPDSFGHVCI